MDVPDLVRESLGGEEIEVGVNLGDEDVVCLTPTRTLLYRAEGLLSDEKVEEYPHNVEQLDVKEGRRKTKFLLEYVEGTRSFSVPPNRDSQVLELLFQGILREHGVIGDDEPVTGAFRFSELTLVVTDRQLIKHIGAVVWTDDYAAYPFADLTGLSFEEGSVATEVVIEVDGRPERIKTPNEHARKVQQLIEDAVFSVHGVGSLEELNATLGDDAESAADERSQRSREDDRSDLDLGGGIDPLVTDDGDEADQAAAEARSDEQATVKSAAGNAGQRTQGRTQSTQQQPRSSSSTQTDGTAGAGRSSDADLQAIEEQLAELTTAVRQHNELLEQQQETIDQLIRELRQGRG